MGEAACLGRQSRISTPGANRHISEHRALRMRLDRFGKVTSFIKAFKIVQDVKRSVSFEAAVARVFSPSAEFIRPSQQPSEISTLLSLLALRRPVVVVEIGTASGGNLLLLARAAAHDALIVSIDLPGGEFGGGYRPWRIPLYRTFAGPKQTIQLIRGNSHAQETVERLMNILGGRGIDFLFIDGDHTYDGVSRDFGLYRSLVRRGGLIALHDIVRHHGALGCDVHRFWQQTKRQFEHAEIVEDWECGFAGIGLIRLSD
jgi:predicted O-methyltransferase YrrM